MPKPEQPDAFRPEESPILWFGELLLAIDRGDFDRAAECQRQLARLGWRVDRRKPRQAARKEGGGR
ncbi:MAG: hypothetical protein P4L85_02660 [Paludisphaera borealis]|uniref:hypothetical protein n=1 Tax=Paludisphaera borealis TaxID=1387353 RepID=UPI0028469677|nr:hypothetical protein [Paludisphaera borealis]MDR3618223.1 hypothetical protein [Paludisphaera borealis]